MVVAKTPLDVATKGVFVTKLSVFIKKNILKVQNKKCCIFGFITFKILLYVKSKSF